MQMLVISRMDEQWILTFSQSDNRIPNLNASIRVQYKRAIFGSTFLEILDPKT